MSASSSGDSVYRPRSILDRPRSKMKKICQIWSEEDEEELSPKGGRGRSLCPRSVVDHRFEPDRVDLSVGVDDLSRLFAIVERLSEGVPLALRPRPRCVDGDIAVWALLNPHGDHARLGLQTVTLPPLARYSATIAATVERRAVLEAGSLFMGVAFRCLGTIAHLHTSTGKLRKQQSFVCLSDRVFYVFLLPSFIWRFIWRYPRMKMRTLCMRVSSSSTKSDRPPRSILGIVDNHRLIGLHHLPTDLSRLGSRPMVLRPSLWRTASPSHRCSPSLQERPTRLQCD